MLRSLCAVMCGRREMPMGMMGFFSRRLMISLGIVLCGMCVVLGCFCVVLCCGAVVLCCWMFCHPGWGPLLASIHDGARHYVEALGGLGQELKVGHFVFVTDVCLVAGFGDVVREIRPPILERLAGPELLGQKQRASPWEDGEGRSQSTKTGGRLASILCRSLQRWYRKPHRPGLRQGDDTHLARKLPVSRH